MATQKNALPAPGAEAPEPVPQAGGSYTRNPDGTLTRNDEKGEEGREKGENPAPFLTLPLSTGGAITSPLTLPAKE